MPRTADWLVIAIGFVIAAAACVLLVDGWSSWTAGPWADCPNYAFGKSWYPEPPLIAVFIPCAASLAASALFVILLIRWARDHRRFPMFIAGTGFAVSVLPLVGTIVLPIVSNALGMTTAGC